VYHTQLYQSWYVEQHLEMMGRNDARLSYVHNRLRLSSCVCVCVCVCVCIHTYMPGIYVHICTRVYAYTPPGYLYIHNKLLPTCSWRTATPWLFSLHISLHTCHIHTHIHTCIHMHIHTYICTGMSTHMNKISPSCSCRTTTTWPGRSCR
jgi:hypothetical protein